VTITIVILLESCVEYPKLFNFNNTFIISTVEYVSKSPVGSSNNKISGELLNDLAIALQKNKNIKIIKKIN